MKKIILLTFITIPLFVNSQNWNLFKINQKTIFAQNYGNLLSVETYTADSIKGNQTKTIYFNRKIGLSNECFNNVLQFAWITQNLPNTKIIDSLVITENKVLYISNYNTTTIDTFTFFPNSEVGDSWTTTKNNITVTCIEKKWNHF